MAGPSVRGDSRYSLYRTPHSLPLGHRLEEITQGT